MRLIQHRSGRSSRCSRTRRSRRRSRPPNRSRFPLVGRERAATSEPCGGVAPAAAPSRTSAWSITLASRSGAAAPVASLPCKHALALLLLWARGQVPSGDRPGYAATWIANRPDPTHPLRRHRLPPRHRPQASLVASPSRRHPPPPDRDPTASRDDRVARMAAGLAELDRWLDDRLRTGLSDPALAQYATWDGLAARLIDAQVGGLANRVRRLAGMVGAHPDWHQHVLAELGSLHLLATAGRQLGSLPPTLADSVAATIGWQVRQADVLGGVPHTDHWAVMGRSDTREDRIEVRRIWLRGLRSGEWAMALSFAAYGQSLDATLGCRISRTRRPVPLPGRARICAC